MSIKKKIFLGIVILGGAIVAYWLISPLFITKKVSEKLEDIMPAPPPPAPALEQRGAFPIPAIKEPELQKLKQGSFIGLAGHQAVGTATLVKIDEKYYVRFEDDFMVTNGPDLFVHFGKDGNYDKEARLDRLKGNMGGQNYEVPSNLNPLDYNEVWVWCRSFFVPFGKAELKKNRLSDGLTR